MAKAAIVQHLKGKALELFHSRSEYLRITVHGLIGKLSRMLYLQSSKTVIRDRFQERSWRRDETFSEYFHEKIIMANLLYMDGDEMLDYLIAGIPDSSLRDQANVQGHRTKDSLLKAFEKVSLRGRLL